MDIFEGLTPVQRGAIGHVSEQRSFKSGEWIFRTGDEAEGLYVVLHGAVDLLREGEESKPSKVLARAEAGETFGEMALFTERKTRTASARAAEPCRLLEIPSNPAQLFRSLQDHETAIRLLQNLICLLGERLKRIDEDERRKELHGFPAPQPVISSPGRPLEVIESLLPRGVLKRFFTNHTLKPEEYLFWEGDEADGFFFIHKGELEVLKLDTQKALRSVGRMKAPTVVGELGFFSGEPRSACLRAIDTIEYSKFSGHDFEKLRKRDPAEALRVVNAAAQLVAHLVAVRG